MSCEHKFAHKSTISYFRYVNRWTIEYVLIDYYFCEKCLAEEERKKRVQIPDDRMEKANLPDWAKAITTSAPGWEYM